MILTAVAAAARTALFIPQVLPAVGIKPQQWLTREPVRREVTYPLAQGEGAADVYEPAGAGSRSAVLISMGVNPMGRADPRVVRLADGLARAGMVVMLPFSETMTSERLDPEEVDNLVRGFLRMSALASVDPDRAGMAGFCVGASMVAVAAADERIRDRVRFVNSFGGYHDARDLVRSVATESRFSDGRAEKWRSNHLSLKLVRKHLIEGVASGAEREALTRAFLEGEPVQRMETEGLSPDAEAVRRLLSGPGPEEVDALLDRLSPATLESMRRISPSAQVGTLKARVLAMHDREDDLVPSEESRRLVDALGPRNDAYYTEFSFFKHVDPTRSVAPLLYVREAFKLFRHMYQIMRQVG